MTGTNNGTAETPKPLRIALLTAFYVPFVSGAERYVIEVVKRLPKDQHVTIVTSRLRRDLPREEMIDGVQVIRVGLGYSWDKYLYPFTGAWTAWRIHPDLVHAVMESFAGGALCLFRLFDRRTPTILTLQSGSIDAPRIVERVPQWVLRWIHTAPDRIQAISEALADRARRFGATDVRVIPNGAELGPFIAQRGAQKRPGLVRTVGRLHVDKGFDILIRAFALVAKKRSDARLEIGGDGPERETLQRLIEELHLTDRVVLRGPIPYPDVPRFMAEAEVFASPSRAEGMGNVFVEAQAAGTAVIGSRVGGIPDIIEEGVTGLLVPNEDIPALADAIVGLLNETDLRDRFVQTAYGRLERYSWDAIARQVSASYRAHRPLRILICTGIYPPEIGGPATFVRELARALHAQGDDVRVMTYGNDKTEQGSGWTVRVVSRSGGSVIRYLRYALATFVAARNADIVFFQGPVSEGFPGTVGAMLAGAPRIMKIVGDHAWEVYMQTPGDGKELLDEFLTHRHAGSVRILETLERWTARQARQIITPSEYLKRVVMQWGVPSDRITVIYNKVPPLPTVAPREVLRQKLGVADSRVILTAVRAVPWKGVDFLLEVIPTLTASDLLVVAGDGPVLDQWKKMAEEKGLTSRVRFLGRVDRSELAEWYAVADAFVLATGYEGFPHVVVEAVTCGLPCFVSDRGGNPETKTMFPDHVTVLPYRDVAVWSSALQKPFAHIAFTHPDGIDYAKLLDRYLEIIRTYAKTV